MLELNLFQFINSQEHYNKNFKATDLTRLPQIKAENKSVNLELSAQLVDKSGKKLRLLHIKINGEINLICHRCNNPLAHKIDINNTVDVFPTQQALENTPIEDESYDSIVGSENFDIQALIEEEILLSLPAFPTHDKCPTHEYIAKEDKPISPFAVLEILKKKTN